MGLMSGFADFIGGAADAGGAILADQRKADLADQNAMKAETYREKLAAARAATIEALRVKKEEDHQRMLTDQGDQIVSQGQEIGKKRDVGMMTRGAAALPSEGEFAGQEIKYSDIENMPPAARKAYEDAGMLPKVTRSGIIGDQMTAARTIGADPSLRTNLQAQYKTTLDDERKIDADETAQRKIDVKEKTDKAERERKEATDKSERERKEKQDKEENRLREKQLNNILAAAEIRADKSSSAAEKSAATVNMSTVMKEASEKEEAATNALRIAPKGTPKAEKLAQDIADAQELYAMARRALMGTLEAGNYKGAVKPKAGNPGKDKPGEAGSTAKAAPMLEPKSTKDYAAMPSGTRYKAPDGSIRTKS